MRYYAQTERRPNGDSWVVDGVTKEKHEIGSYYMAQKLAELLNAGAMEWEDLFKPEPSPEQVEEGIAELFEGIVMMAERVSEISAMMDTIADALQELEARVDALEDKMKNTLVVSDAES